MQCAGSGTKLDGWLTLFCAPVLLQVWNNHDVTPWWPSGLEQTKIHLGVTIACPVATAMLKANPSSKVCTTCERHVKWVWLPTVANKWQQPCHEKEKLQQKLNPWTLLRSQDIQKDPDCTLCFCRVVSLSQAWPCEPSSFRCSAFSCHRHHCSPSDPSTPMELWVGYPWTSFKKANMGSGVALCIHHRLQLFQKAGARLCNWWSRALLVAKDVLLLYIQHCCLFNRVTQTNSVGATNALENSGEEAIDIKGESHQHLTQRCRVDLTSLKLKKTVESENHTDS